LLRLANGRDAWGPSRTATRTRTVSSGRSLCASGDRRPGTEGWWWWGFGRGFSSLVSGTGHPVAAG
jgi:hypothetical protein